jgi:multidrug efflux pump subunit AcrA (membrane-fusion protein)
VKTVTAQIGQRVHAGDLLVQIDDSTLSAQQSQAAANLAQVEANSRGGNISAQANLNSARIAYETAQANLRRNEQLLQQGYVSKAAIDQARQQAASADAAYRAAQATAQNASLGTGRDSAATAALRSAEAALRTVNSEIAQASVRAPFDGVVAARNVDPGSLASPGSVLMEVAQLDPLFVDVGIAGDQLGHVHVGTPVTVTVSSFGARTWHGNIGYLDLAAVPGTSIYQARIPLANPDLALRGGMVATVSFQQSRKANVLLVPRTAVFQTDAGYSMFVIDGGKAKAVPVEVGLSNDQETEVSGAGLKPGVQAILNHSPLLQPGTPVQVMPAQTSAHS